VKPTPGTSVAVRMPPNTSVRARISAMPGPLTWRVSASRSLDKFEQNPVRLFQSWSQ
jgi:tRNA A37 threonylcarbamoyladenosine synthetase subunit TsaC/SUA5/YrdC